MTNVMDAFNDGEDRGRLLGEERRNRIAFRNGDPRKGALRVAYAAGADGDMETYDSAITSHRRSVTHENDQRQFADETTQRAYERLEKVRPFALGAIERARQLPPEQRAQWFNQPQIRQRFLDTGVTEEQWAQILERVGNPQNSDAELDNFAGVYTRHQAPDWQVSEQTGETYAIDPDTGQPRVGGEVPGADLIQRGAEADVAGAERDARAPYPSSNVYSGNVSPQQFQRANTLRDEYAQQTGNWRSVADVVNRSEEYIRRIQSGAAQPNGQSDIGLVYALAKVYDPTSVVREGEFATVARSGGLGPQIQNYVNRIFSSGELPSNIRNGIITSLRESYAAQEQQRAQVRQRYETLATQSGIDPAMVIDDYDYGQAQPAAPPPRIDPNNPPPGAVRDPATGRWRVPRGGPRGAPAPPPLSPQNPGQR